MMTRLLVGVLTPAIRAKLFLHMAAPERGAETPKTSGGGRPLSRDPKRKRARSHKAAPGPRTIRDGRYLVARRRRVNRNGGDQQIQDGLSSRHERPRASHIT